MKRLGVFQLYDKDGYVDEYKYVLLESMLTVLDHLIIVINGFVEDKVLLKLKKYTNDIHIREDIGYDAGAFRDVFLKFYKRDFFEEWDEVVLFNDTFYGPFYPWALVFDRMRKENVDFWGLERRIYKKEVLGRSEVLIQPEYLATYFIVVRKKMMMSKEFIKFWVDVGYPVGYKIGVEIYEARFARYFKEAGFNFTTWLDIKGFNNREIVLWDYAYAALRYYEFPIIKVKAFSVVNVAIMDKMFDYIKNQTKYDVKIIERHIERLILLEQFYPFSPIKLKEFIESHNNIYIFGHGDYGLGLEQYFHKKNWKLKAFVVSEAKKEDEISLKDICLEKNDGIIVALGTFALNEVKEKLKELFAQDQLLFPSGR